MTDFLFDPSKIILQENIPLTAQDITSRELQNQKFAKTIPVVVGICTIFTMTFIAWLIRKSFVNFHYYDYILFLVAGLLLFGFCYFISWLVNSYDSSNWKKDKLNGKNRLTSVVINRDKTEYGEYLTFAGPYANKKIRLKVKQHDYRFFQIGTKIIVTYLKFSKEAIEIIEF